MLFYHAVPLSITLVIAVLLITSYCRKQLNEHSNDNFNHYPIVQCFSKFLTSFNQMNLIFFFFFYNKILNLNILWYLRITI